MNNSIIRELKEEARKDSVTNFISRNKSLIAKIAIGLFVLLVCYFIYSYNLSKKEAKFSKTFHQALLYEKAGKVDESIALLEEIKDNSSAPQKLKSIASLRLAAGYLSKQETAKALQIYENIAFNNSNDKFIRELSSLLLSKMIVHNVGNDIDEKRYRNAIVRIKKLIDKTDILKLQIQEQLAIIYIKMGKGDEARKILEQIKSSPEASKSIKSRAQDLTKITP